MYHFISAGGIKRDSKKVEALLTARCPITYIDEIRPFCGSASRLVSIECVWSH